MLNYPQKIKKAWTASKTNWLDHFADVGKMVDLDIQSGILPKNPYKVLIKITPSSSSGKLIQLNNHNVIAEISPRGQVYSLEKIYTVLGEELVEGSTLDGRTVNSSFYDDLYQDVDDGQYFEVPAQQKVPRTTTRIQ